MKVIKIIVEKGSDYKKIIKELKKEFFQEKTKKIIIQTEKERIDLNIEDSEDHIRRMKEKLGK